MLIQFSQEIKLSKQELQTRAKSPSAFVASNFSLQKNLSGLVTYAWNLLFILVLSVETSICTPQTSSNAKRYSVSRQRTHQRFFMKTLIREILGNFLGNFFEISRKSFLNFLEIIFEIFFPVQGNTTEMFWHDFHI